MSVRLSYDEFIHIGKAKYQEKKYDLAYDYFKRALSTLKTPNLDILDFLAATCEKLGNTSEALKYGSQMIKSHSTSAKGYLRVGRSLQLANKDGYKEKEIAIYDRGLGKVPRIDPQYKLLEGVRHVAFRVLCPPTAVDPFSILPTEICQEILQYLNFHEIVYCLRVSKGWKRYLESTPSLWRVLDLAHGKSGKQRRIPNQFVKNCIKLSERKIERANLGAYANPATILSLVRCCPNLQAIETGHGSDVGVDTTLQILQHGKQLDFLSLSAGMSSDSINQVLNASARLTRLHLNWFCTPSATRLFQLRVDLPKLKHFECLSLLPHPSSVTVQLLEAFFLRAPNLETLTLSKTHMQGRVNFKLLEKLKSLTLRTAYIDLGFELPSSVTNLELNDVHGAIEQSFLPSLTHLDLSKCSQVPDTITRLIAYDEIDESGGRVTTKGVHVKSLTVRGMEWREYTVSARIHRQDLRGIFKEPRLSRLETLVVQAPEFDDEVAEVIANQIKTLTALRIADGQLTGVGIKALVLSQKQLKWLVLENCVKVSPDAISWVEGQGVNVMSRLQLATAGQRDRSAHV